MSEEELRVGVVGAGWFASRRHMPDLTRMDGVTVASVCRRDEVQLEVVADAFGVSGRYRDYGEMLEAETLDAVVVSTPPALHYEQARAALERGLHVLLEKPMTLTAPEADELVVLAKRRERMLAVALNPPYWSHTRTAREAVATGTIGRVESAALHWVGNVEAVFGRAPLPADMPGVVRPTLYRGDPELSGGGHLLDTGSHLISEMLWVTGLAARTVSAQMDDPTLDMRASVQVMLDGDTPCDVVCVGDSRHPERRIRNQYFGSEGTLTIEGMPFRVTVERSGEFPETLGEEDMPEAPGPAADFADAIRRGRLAASPGAHGADVVRVVETAYRSARTGQREVV